MRLLLTVALSLVSLSSCASNEITNTLSAQTNPIVSGSTQTSPIVVQKAQASGVVFVSNADRYQLISGGRAVKKGTSILALSASQTGTQSKLLWEAANGAFELSISSEATAQQSAQALPSGSNYNQIAYNPRTGGVAIITGQIIVTYTANFNADFIGESFGIQLAQDFAHLKTAFYTVNAGQDIFLITKSINQSGLVSSAEIEVIENFANPL